MPDFIVKIDPDLLSPVHNDSRIGFWVKHTSLFIHHSLSLVPNYFGELFYLFHCGRLSEAFAARWQRNFKFG